MIEQEKSRRFAVAVSFPGEHRRFVRNVVERLSEVLTKERVFFDEWYTVELVGIDGDLKLKRFYREESELVVPFFSKHYEKPWCEIEWHAIRAILMARRKDDCVVPIELDNTQIEGWEAVDFAIRKKRRSGKQIADLIIAAYKYRRAQVDDANAIPSQAQASQDFLHLCRECIRQLERGRRWDDYTIHIENLLPDFEPLCKLLAIGHPPLTLEQRRDDGVRIAYLYWPFNTELGGRRVKISLIAGKRFNMKSRMEFRLHSLESVLENFSAWVREIEHRISRGEYVK